MTEDEANRKSSPYAVYSLEHTVSSIQQGARSRY